MADKNSLPSLQDLTQYGRVAPIAMYMGLLLFTIGAFGEISLSNKKLMIGGVFICFSLVWHYLTTMVDANLYDGQRDVYSVNWSAVLGFVVFALADALLIFGLLKGRIPFRLPS